MRGRPNTSAQLASSRDLFLFAALPVAVGSLLAGLSGFAVLCWSGVASWSDFAEGARTFAIGDAVGVAAVAPALLAGRMTVAGLRRELARGRDQLEAALQTAGIVATPFIPVALSGERDTLLAMTLVPLTWVALRRQFATTTVALFAAAAATTIAAAISLGESIGLTDIQLFLVATAVITLAIADVMRRLRRSQYHLAVQAATDPLTGLPNRSDFLERVREALTDGDEAAVLFFDLDRFKLVNDTLGHEIGDRLLVEVGKRLRASLDRQAAVARFGGDEFTALVRGEGAADVVAHQAGARILEALSEPFLIDGNRISIGATIGLARADGDLTNPTDLMRHADIALYEAKDHGGGRIAIFDERMSERSERRAATEAALRDAIEGGQLSLAYQPIADLRRPGSFAIEALLRWESPELGVVDPPAFIPLAEETGLILPIGRWVIEEVARQSAEWRAARGGATPPVFVNVSAAQLREGELIAHLEDTLGAAGVPASGLSLELTETLLVEDFEEALEVMAKVRALGVGLVLDDFGTGYSSLSYLRRLPVQTVKVDREFVHELSDATVGDSIMAAVIELSHRLGLAVVGEGIETDEQLRILRALGCDAAQGWLLGRPGPPSQIR